MEPNKRKNMTPINRQAHVLFKGGALPWPGFWEKKDTSKLTPRDFIDVLHTSPNKTQQESCLLVSLYQAQKVMLTTQRGSVDGGRLFTTGHFR